MSAGRGAVLKQSLPVLTGLVGLVLGLLVGRGRRHSPGSARPRRGAPVVINVVLFGAGSSSSSGS
jgi:hypothetical protein